MEKPHLVAVYGSLLSDLGNHHIMQRLGSEHFELVGETKTNPEFEIYPVGGNWYPGVLENGKTAITVEVYKVSEQLLKGPLDTLEGYHENDIERSHYIRKTIKTEFGDTFIYIYNRKPSSDPIESGNWREYLESLDNQN